MNDEGEWQAGGFCPLEDQRRMGMTIGQFVQAAACCYVEAAAKPGLTAEERWMMLFVSLGAAAGIDMELDKVA